MYEPARPEISPRVAEIAASTFFFLIRNTKNEARAAND
jgi:hypothetical protein